MSNTKIKSVKFNVIMNFILTASTFIFPLITFPYVSRILQPIGTGKVTLAISVVTYFSMFSMLGIPTYGIRVCAIVRDNKEKLTKTVLEILTINLIMTLFVIVVYVTSIFLIPKLWSEKYLYAIVGITIIFNTLGVEWLYKGLEQYSYITKRSIAFKFIALIAMILFIKRPEDYIIYGALSILANCGSNILNFINLRKYIDLKYTRGLNFKRHFKPILVFFSMSVATTIYTNLDSVMLGFMAGDEEVGYYNVGIKVKSILMSLVTALGSVLLPRLSYYIEQKKYDEFNRLIKKSINYVLLVSIPLIIYFVYYSPEVVRVLAGKGYEGAIVPIYFIMPTIMFIGITNILGIQILVPLGKEKIVLYSVCIGAVTDLIINIMLIPTFKSTGAAIGTFIAELFVLIYQLWIVRKNIVPLLKEIDFIKIIISSLIAFIATISCRNYVENSLLVLVISSIIFFLVYIGCLLLSKEKFSTEMLRKIFINRDK